MPREEVEHRERLREVEAHAEEIVEQAEERLEEAERRAEERKARLRDTLPPPADRD